MDASQPGNLAPQLPPGLREQLRDKLGRKLGWKLNRLRCMTAAEVVHRALRAAQARLEKAGWLGSTEVPWPDMEVQGKRWVRKPEVDPRPYVAAANRIAEGWLDVFAIKGLDFGSPPRWNRDPKTGIEAPLVFGKLLDYRDPDVVGDIKYLWEPNRHLHLVTLAQAHALTGDAKYSRVIAEHLESWFLACPYPLGPNWSSALEPALRLINWSITYQLLNFGESQNQDLRDRWLASIYQHCKFIRGWFSLHSSANNHLIGEATALYIAAQTWPHWKESEGWRATAKAILEREALAQNAEDGVNLEQAIYYQQFVFDFLLLAMLAGNANGDPFPPAYAQRLEAMLDYVCSVMDAGGNIPMIGDADDGFVARFFPGENFPVFKSLLATGAVLFRRGDFKKKAGALDDKTRWLLGPRAQAEWGALDASKGLPPRQQFAQGGCYILGCDFDTPREVRVVADAGPLGYRSIAAHGHADALSFTLSVGGREWLVDPGTYAYHTQARWRDYFRGTGAHNTVRVDGLDQSVSGGNFMWLAKARAGCSLWLSSADRDTFEGWHDGYMRLPDPVKHRRLVELDKRSRRLVVEDTLEMAEEHDVELLFHCSDQCSVERVEGGLLLSQGDKALMMRLPSAQSQSLAIYRGSVQPIFGWVSREFDRRLPAPTIVWRARLGGNCVLRTEIDLP